MRPRGSLVVVIVTVLASVGVAAIGLAAPAQVPNLGPAVLRASTPVAADRTSTAELLDLSRAMARDLLKVPAEGSARIEKWPLAPAVQGSIVVTRHQIYADDARILTFRNGREVELPRSRLVFFWGPADTDPYARALLWVDPTTLVIDGVSTSLQGTFQLLPPARAGAAQRFIDAERAGREGGVTPAWGCGTSAASTEALSGVAASAQAFAGPAGATFASLQKMTVAVDTDSQLMQHKFANDTFVATNYVAALLASMSLTYERDLNLKLVQGTTILRPQQAPDPYVQDCAGNACSAALNEFSSYWAANYGAVSRGLAMMLSENSRACPRHRASPGSRGSAARARATASTSSSRSPIRPTISCRWRPGWSRTSGATTTEPSTRLHAARRSRRAHRHVLQRRGGHHQLRLLGGCRELSRSRDLSISLFLKDLSTALERRGPLLPAKAEFRARSQPCPTRRCILPGSGGTCACARPCWGW